MRRVPTRFSYEILRVTKHNAESQLDINIYYESNPSELPGPG
jgi:hypothetical protein